MARPPKLNATIQASIIENIELGVPVETACQAEGINPATYYRWQQWGGQGKQPYVEFCEALARAKAKAEIALVKTSAGGDDKGVSNGPAKCAQWLLERTRGKRYAARVNIRVEEELETLLDVVERICSGKDCGCLEAILDALAARAGGEAAEGAQGAESAPIH